MKISPEYEKLHALWEKALFGSFLIMPLKYDGLPKEDYILRYFEPVTLNTPDIGENVKDMINLKGSGNIGRAYSISRVLLEQEVLGERYERLTVRKEGVGGEFSFLEGYLYVFHTKIAFLCVGIRYDALTTLYNICNPGYADATATADATAFTGHRRDGSVQAFSLEKALCAFAEKCGMRKFFDGKSSAILESYVYNLALLPERFESIEIMRQATFNLHLMEDLTKPAEDESEEDLRYVYAVKDQSLGSYSWGCCVSSQTMSYVRAHPSMNLDAEMGEQAENGLPVVLIALYEKFTCLRFTELLRQSADRDKHQLDALKNMMLKFQACGTVAPANLSRWHNIKQLYADLLTVNDTFSAVADIDNKLKILAEQQQVLEQRKNDTVSGIITVFGVVSIVDSMLSIEQSLCCGQPLDWITVGGTLAALGLVITVMLRKLKGN